ncbi:Wzy polymerase domain-containing protein [Paucibacter sp. B2R-40]|uniref:PglL family O-oligosaccharyltransferase n=1 Tax=Paucibacter sp. B2R-40 TaxID=2893554 RepID=UPI0021E4D808|nr:O-antigen ligase family protein [Paucibacter sp. B2R-40]MCV2352560.1 Wzy polymerase domain-containing protein [Paucibacter sp. B2R-40]
MIHQAIGKWRGNILTLALALPFICVFGIFPSPTACGQSLSWIAWGLAVLLLPSCTLGAMARNLKPLLIFFAVFGFAVLVSAAILKIPLDYTYATLGFIAGALCVLYLGAAGGASPQAASLFNVICRSLILAGMFNAVVGILQVYASELTDGTLMVESHLRGRATGNTRQPNHLAYLLLWSMAAIAATVEAEVLRRRWAVPMLFTLSFALVLSASRTGLLGLILLTAWAFFDPGTGRKGRNMLRLTPLLFAAAWLLALALAGQKGIDLGAQTRLADGASSPPRMVLLRDAWQLMREHMYWGVGWGEFNFVWTLTPTAVRTKHHFDNLHNIILQWSVELGIPVAIMLTGLISWAFVRAFRLSKADSNIPRRGCLTYKRYAFLMAALMIVPSLLEYPLWYAFFLFPTVFMLGFCLAPAAAIVRKPGVNALGQGIVGLLMIFGGVFIAYDFSKVVQVFQPPAHGEAAPLQERLAIGNSSVFFSNWANYGGARRLRTGKDAELAAEYASHGVIDTRLLVAWIKSLHEIGDDKRARYLAARLAEFNDEQAKKLLAPCKDELSAAQAFQCGPAVDELSYRDFRTLRWPANESHK